MKFEYIEFLGDDGPAWKPTILPLTIERLDALGVDGWELVHMDPDWKRAILKRQLP